MPTLRHAQHLEARAGRKSARAQALEGRAAQIRDTHVRPRTGEVGPLAERHAARLEAHAGRQQAQADVLQRRSTALAPNLTPGSDPNAARPVTPNEPVQGPQVGTQTATPPAQPYTYTDPRIPYSGFNPTIQQQATPGTEATIAPYYVGAGPTGQRYEDWLTSEYNQNEDRTTGRFADMFSKYVDVARREADRQAGQIGESLGSRGALYSSANLGQQADLRQKTAADIANTAAQYQTGLEDQRQRAWQAIMGGQAGLATAEMGGREAAMGRAWQDFLRQSDIPPEFGAGQQWASTRPSAGHYAKF